MRKEQYLYQADILMGKELTYKKFIATKDSDHEHCNLCGAKFSESENDLKAGYVTEDERGWVCQECLEYYGATYHWNIRKN